MNRVTRSVTSFVVTVGLAASLEGAIRPGTSIAAALPSEAEGWGLRILRMVASGELTVASAQRDGDFPGRRHLRYDQRVGGVRVFGFQLVQEVDEQGRTLSVFGHRLEEAAPDTTPRLTTEQAVTAALAAAGRDARAYAPVELVVLPLDDRTILAYTLKVAQYPRLDRYFVDAQTGAVALRYSDLQTIAAVGIGKGVWDDRKKVSADNANGTFKAADKLRPAPITTYDLRYDFGEVLNLFYGGVPSSSFVAEDSDNNWTDGPIVNTHVYAGYAYDYYLKRHNRRAIDDNDSPIEVSTHGLAGYDNAFWNGASGFYGDGDGINYNNFASGIDVVPHELSHGVTQFTWGGIYMGESGALNESFSDFMGTSVEFFFEPAGYGRLKADYFLGEDLSFTFAPEVFAIRSLENPGMFCSPAPFGCDPDNYSKLVRFSGPCGDENDNCGVHINCGISNQAYYLLIEGGTNRTSGIRVTGLGPENRDKVEKIFYRGFTAFLTPNARFSDARAATIRAAQELYGDDAAAKTAAVWTAVGVR
jgi:thermolysin